MHSGEKTVPRDHKNTTSETNENMQFSTIKSIEKSYSYSVKMDQVMLLQLLRNLRDGKEPSK